MTTEKKNVIAPIIGALIVNREGKILLAKNVRWNDQYVVFGGHVEYGESLEAAVRRETMEEVGIELGTVTGFGFGEYTPKKEEAAEHYTGKHLIFLDFVCQYHGPDDAIKLNSEYEKDSQIWVSLDEAIKLDLGGGTKGMLERYQEFIRKESYLDDLKRLQADFENYKKRIENERKDTMRFITTGIISDLVPILDNFNMAVAHVPEDKKSDPWVTGITYIERQFEEVLAGFGVSVMEVKVGDDFDPTRHEAVSSEPSSAEAAEGQGKEAHKIVKVLQKGYLMGDKVIRAAKVTVN